jgi:hypothetical protein
MLPQLQILHPSTASEPNLSHDHFRLDLSTTTRAEWERKCNFQSHTSDSDWRLAGELVALPLCHKLFREPKRSPCRLVKIPASRANLVACSPVSEAVSDPLPHRVVAHCHTTDKAPSRKILKPEK